jgi:hypothetical protein
MEAIHRFLQSLSYSCSSALKECYLPFLLHMHLELKKVIIAVYCNT